jgi:D-threo-aldose 1-dehydrogenase
VDPGDIVTVGNRGLKVSRLGMGTGPLGKYDDDHHWAQIVEAAWSQGIRYFDTSPFYGLSTSERHLGRELQKRPRDEFAISTKVGRLLRREGPVEPFEQAYFYPNGVPDGALRGRYDYSRQGALQSIADSYERLRLARVDIVYVHDIVELSSGVSHEGEVISEALPALFELRDHGTIKAVGIGVQVNGLLRDIALATDIDICLLAGRYTLLDQSSLDEALPAAAEKGVAIVIGSPYNTGILHDPRPTSTFDFVQAPEELIEKATRIKAACERHGVPLPAAAIQFPFGHSSVVAVLTGAETAAELNENASLMRVDIPEDLWHELRDSELIRADAPLPCEAGHAGVAS